MKNPWISERLTPGSRELARGSFRFWYGSAGRSMTGPITFEPGIFSTRSWAIRGCHEYNVGRRVDGDRAAWPV